MAKFLRPLRPESGELLHLDLLRFVASCAVVFNHSGEFFFRPTARPIFAQHIGTLGLFVDMFFAISGYVISYIYRDRVLTLPHYGKFLQRRVGRLVPLHWLMLLLMILVGAAAAVLRIHVAHGGMFDERCIWTSALLLNSMGICSSLAFNGPSWSISAEMVMYVAFPLIVVVANRHRHLPLLACMGLCAVLFIARPFAQTMGPWYLWTYAGGPIRALPSFLFGVWLFYNRILTTRLPHPEKLMLAALVALCVGIPLGAPAAALFAVTYFIVAAAVAADLGKRSSALTLRLAPLGQLTYSIYMIHALVVLVVMNAVADKILHLGGTAMIAAGLVCYAVIGVAGYCSFLFVETPARRWIDGLRFGAARDGRPPPDDRPTSAGDGPIQANVVRKIEVT